MPVSVRARQVILAIVSYNKNPCLKFELMGCEDNEDDILLGYNSGYPICVGMFEYIFFVDAFLRYFKFIPYEHIFLSYCGYFSEI